MKRIYFFIFFVLKNISLQASQEVYIPLQSTLPAITYPLDCYVPHPANDEWRSLLDREPKSVQDLVTGIPANSIRCLPVPESHKGHYKNFREDYYKCFQYAIERVTGFKDYIDFPNKGNVSIALSKYFTQVTNPEKGDLCVVVNNEKDLSANHFMVAEGRACFSSKFGNWQAVFGHMKFCICSCYGNALIFLRLLEQYRHDNDLLLHHMQEDIEKAKQNVPQEWQKQLEEMKQQIYR